MEYTKGEWKVDDTFRDGIAVVALLDKYTPQLIFEPCKMELANAYLISAAPDMYEALKMLPEQIQWIPEVAQALTKAETRG